MRILQGTEQMIFSYAYYTIADVDSVMNFFNTLEDKGLFNIDNLSLKNKEMSGAFVQDYPKRHWNPMAGFAGAKQVIGGVEIKEGILKIDTKTKGGLKNLKLLLEQTLQNSIKFQKEE